MIPQIPDYVNLSRNKPIMPEILKAHGMTTAVDNANCWSLFDIIDRGWDSSKFFMGYEDILPSHPDPFDSFYLTAPNTLAWAQEWLARHRNQRFFLWVHFIEPHSPYNPPRDYDKFRTPDDFPNLYDDNSEQGTKLRVLGTLRNYHAVRRLWELYAAKILYVDHYIGEMLQTVRNLDLQKNTIIILVSDHGELLFSHPEDFNGADHRSLYDSTMHVPLIF
jgi:arylsulfatase A-like enzyme